MKHELSKLPRRSVKRPPNETRDLMLEIVGRLLETRAPWDIRASEIAAAAGTTQPNFYSHFRNMEEAITARSQQVWALYPTDQLAALLERALVTNDLTALQNFFIATVAFWQAHGGLLRAVSRVPGDEHPAIRDIRHQAQDPVIACCAQAIRQAQAAGQLSATLNPQLAANAALRFLDEAANHYRTIREASDFSSDDIAATISLMFRLLLTGR